MVNATPRPLEARGRDPGPIVKVKVKAVYGSYSTAALRHIVLLPE